MSASSPVLSVSYSASMQKHWGLPHILKNPFLFRTALQEAESFFNNWISKGRRCFSRNAVCRKSDYVSFRQIVRLLTLADINEKDVLVSHRLNYPFAKYNEECLFLSKPAYKEDSIIEMNTKFACLDTEACREPDQDGKEESEGSFPQGQRSTEPFLGEETLFGPYLYFHLTVTGIEVLHFWKAAPNLLIQMDRDIGKDMVNEMYG